MIRRRLYENRELGEAVRDIESELDRFLPMELIEFTDVYAEPMTVRTAAAPVAVLALDVREDASPDESIVAWAPVNFTLTKSGFSINAIEGPLTGTKYRFTLLVIGAREAG